MILLFDCSCCVTLKCNIINVLYILRLRLPRSGELNILLLLVDVKSWPPNALILPNVVSCRQFPLGWVWGAWQRPPGPHFSRIHCQSVWIRHQTHGSWSAHGVPKPGALPLLLPPVPCDLWPRFSCWTHPPGGHQSSTHLWAGHEQSDSEGKWPMSRVVGGGFYPQHQSELLKKGF